MTDDLCPASLDNSKWTGVELHCHAGSTDEHVSGLLADGVGAGCLHHRHGHCWRGESLPYLPPQMFFFPHPYLDLPLCTSSASSRRAGERRASGIGPDLALDTTQWRMVASRSQRGSARSLAVSPLQGWRSNTSWQAKRGPSGTCSTQTGPTTGVPKTSKASSVSWIRFSFQLDHMFRR